MLVSYCPRILSSVRCEKKGKEQNYLFKNVYCTTTMCQALDQLLEK